MTVNDVDGLRRGAREHRAAGDAVTELGQLLAAIGVQAGPLGTVPSAGGFADGVVAARDTQRGYVLEEAARRGELGQRADGTADLGEHLISLTSADAGRVPAARFPFLGGG